MLFVALIFAVLLAFLALQYLQLRRAFFRVLEECDASNALTRKAIEERDAAVEVKTMVYKECINVLSIYTAYVSPFQRPFTSARSGMGIKKD